MTIDNNLIITLASILFSVGSFATLVMWRLKIIEQKQDKHNNLIERMMLAERDIKSAHVRIDSCKVDLKNATESLNRTLEKIERGMG